MSTSRFRMAPGTASGALLSCLGFPGWGGLHLVLPSRGDPSALARRLQLSLAEPGATDQNAWGQGIPAGQVLPALLRRHRDLEPLHPDHWPWARGTAMAWPPNWGHRYLLICRWGAVDSLRLSAWRHRGSGGWVRLCEPIPLPCFQERFAGNQEMTKATPSPTTIKAMAPTAQ
ncbi:MAG: hypothetical protein KME02_01190 [Aphanothece saxicola GSE-SYN-MK-01-06B]|nr:hypothetical protein [Aphanothece saxicola GSE-SYN-MK-01-06B]